MRLRDRPVKIVKSEEQNRGLRGSTRIFPGTLAVFVPRLRDYDLDSPPANNMGSTECRPTFARTPWDNAQADTHIRSLTLRTL
jgi:hypothetical protein